MSKKGRKMTLSEIKPGRSCQVTGWSSQLSNRLLELGLLPGTLIEVVRTAPFGDPVAYKVKNCQLAIARADTVHIYVDAM